MRHTILVITMAFFVLSCEQNSSKKKESEVIEEKASQNKNRTEQVTASKKNIEQSGQGSEVTTDIKVKAFLIYSTGKLSNFDILNDENIALYNTIIGGGSAEDKSEKTKIIITGTAKNINLLIKNGDIVSIEKKGFDITNEAEFIVPDTGCDEVTIKITVDNKDIYTGKIQFVCGE